MAPKRGYGVLGDGEFGMLRRRNETALHTEWKSVEDPSVLRDVFTRKLG
jgi:hypothetical protein